MVSKIVFVYQSHRCGTIIERKDTQTTHVVRLLVPYMPVARTLAWIFCSIRVIYGPSGASDINWDCRVMYALRHATLSWSIAIALPDSAQLHTAAQLAHRSGSGAAAAPGA